MILTMTFWFYGSLVPHLCNEENDVSLPHPWADLNKIINIKRLGKCPISEIGFFDPLQCILDLPSLRLLVLGSKTPPPPLLSFYRLFCPGEISCCIFCGLPLQIQLLDEEQVAGQG